MHGSWWVSRIEVLYGVTMQPVWPDWAIYWTLGNFLKPLATINLPKSPTFLGNFCKCAKIYHCSNEIIFGQPYRDLAIFFWSHWMQLGPGPSPDPPDRTIVIENWLCTSTFHAVQNVLRNLLNNLNYFVIFNFDSLQLPKRWQWIRAVLSNSRTC